MWRVTEICAGLALASGLIGAIAWAATDAPRNPLAAEASTAPAPAAQQVRLYLPSGEDRRLRLPDGSYRIVKSILRVPGQLRFGEFVWNDADVPAGSTWVRVDLSRQLVSVFRGGHEVGTSLIVFGAEKKASPTGAFRILQKAEHYYSRTYDAPMPYSLRLTADGVALHASDVRPGRATHGCIGTPPEFCATAVRSYQRRRPCLHFRVAVRPDALTSRRCPKMGRKPVS